MPKLVIFDLDFTLWDCGGTWVDCSSPPYRSTAAGVFDQRGRQMQLYPDVLAILQYCERRQLPMALASRTSEPDWARQLMPLLLLEGYFAAAEIYPGSKVTHVKKLQTHFSVAFDQMVFFDDEMRNIDEVGALGVNAVYVEAGLNWDVFRSCIAED